MPHKNELGVTRHRHDKLGYGKTHHKPRGLSDSDHQHQLDKDGMPCCGQGGGSGGGLELIESAIIEKQKADLTAYRFDNFDTGPSYGVADDGGTWSGETCWVGNEGHDYKAWDDADPWGDITTSWSFTQKTVGSSFVESMPASWPETRFEYEKPPFNPDSSGRWHAVGERYNETWYKFTVPTHATGAAGIKVTSPSFNNGSNIYNDHQSLYSRQAGYQLRVATTEPASRRDGTLIASGFQSGVEMIVPIANIPAAGSTVWIGFAPNWDTLASDPVSGPYLWPSLNNITATDFNTLAMQGCGSDGVERSFPTDPVWVVYDFDPNNGWVSVTQDEDSWFEGSVPVSDYDETDGAWGYDSVNETMYFLPTAATNGSGYLEWAGAADQDLPEDYEEPLGEPWSEDNGYRALIRFKISAAGSAVDAGTRALTVAINNGDGPVYMRAHLGDTTDNAGIEIGADELTSAVDKAIAADTWYWMWVDTRNPDKVRGKLFEDLHSDLPLLFAGEPPAPDVEITRTLPENDETATNYMRLTVEAGNASGQQQVDVSHIYFIGPANHGEIVEEFIGEGDDSSTTYTASMPVAIGSLSAFAWGQKIDITMTDREFGTFTSADGQAVPDYGRIKVVYECDREQVYDDDTDYSEEEV